MLLLHGRDRDADRRPIYRALTRQTVFLSRRWKAAAPGLPRFEALTGLIYAGHLADRDGASGRPRRRGPCRATAQPTSTPRAASPRRNPEELLEVLTLLDLVRAGA